MSMTQLLMGTSFNLFPRQPEVGDSQNAFDKSAFPNDKNTRIA